MKMEHGCTKGTKTDRMPKNVEHGHTDTTNIDGRIKYQNIEHGRTKGTNKLRPTARMCT